MTARDLTPAAIEGFVAADGRACPYLASSPNWFAWTVGRCLARTGRSAPRDVRMGRGYQVHANGMLWAVAADSAVTRIN